MRLFASVRPRAEPMRSPLRVPGAVRRTTALRLSLAAALVTLLLASGARAAPSGAAAASPGAIRGDPAPSHAISALEVGAWCLVGVVVLVWLASDRGSLSRRRRR
ncbi:MAG: hypothetical protein QOK40_1949 [Miltoncostaeaceae bacterium]|nr:hypothetical protein [Miltoncostaeaceae bacterium]